MWAKSSWSRGQRRTRVGARRPTGPGRARWEATPLAPASRVAFHPLSIRPSLSPAGSPCLTSSLPLPPSCPLKRLGSDHLDVWALQGDREGQREAGCFLPPPCPRAAVLLCANANVSQSLPSPPFPPLPSPPVPSLPFCVLPTSPISPPPLPRHLPKELRCQLRVGGHRA